MTPPARWPLLALFVGACCIGLAPIFPKYVFDLERALDAAGRLPNGARPLGMVAAAFWRMALAAPVLWALHWRTERLRAGARSPISLRTRAWLAAPGLVFAGDMAAWHKAFEYTSLANATLLANFATIIVSVIGFVWFRERLGWGFVAGAGCALAGAAVLLGVDFGMGADPLRGDLYGLLTAGFYATYLLSIKRLRVDHGVVRIMAHSTTACALGLLPLAMLTSEGLWPNTPTSWLALFALAMVSHAAGQGLITYALAHLPGGFATVSLLVQPVVTAVVSWALFAQALTPIQIGGGLLVLTGIAIARRASGAAVVAARSTRA